MPGVIRTFLLEKTQQYGESPTLWVSQVILKPTQARTHEGKALVVNILALATRNALASALTSISQQNGASVTVQLFVLPRTFLGFTTKPLVMLQAPVLVAILTQRKHLQAVCILMLKMLL